MNVITLIVINSTLFCSLSMAFASSEVKELHVYKSERKLELIGRDNQVLKSYRVMLGRNPEGHKEMEGDFKTPEGEYTLDLKLSQSEFHRAFHISYPNWRDKLKARARRVNPGGDIMLHGHPNNFSKMTEWLKTVGLEAASDEVIHANLIHYDWTSGCVAVSDEEIDEIFQMVDVPAKIIISP